MNLIECLNEGVSYLKESKFQIYPLNDYNIIPIIKLYSNCKEISSISIHDGSGGLTMTSISPENWFVDILPSILEGASMVVCSRVFVLLSLSLEREVTKKGIKFLFIDVNTNCKASAT